MRFTGNSIKIPLLFVLACLASFAAKIYCASLGLNFDMMSYQVVTNIVREGGSVYAQTDRYNYGPIWFYTLRALEIVDHYFGSNGTESYHRVIAGFLALVDTAIAVILARRYSLQAALVFLLCPMAMIISGYHSQFDNFAILLALAAFGLIARIDRGSSMALCLAASVVLGVSLTIKHIGVFLPIWFLLRPDWSLRQRLVLSTVPVLVFLASFTPWLGSEAARRGIIDHVFLYNGIDNGIFPQLLYLAVPKTYVSLLCDWVPVFRGIKTPWLLSMAGCGYVFRNVQIKYVLPLYLACLVTLSTAIANQYLVIPLIFCAVAYRNPLAWLYMVAGTMYLTYSGEGLGGVKGVRHYMEKRHLDVIQSTHVQVFLLLLLVLMIYQAWRQGVRARARKSTFLNLTPFIERSPQAVPG